MKSESLVSAVLFDFGGVITASPFEAFARYEAEVGVPTDSIRKINSTNPNNNAWAKMERSEVSLDEFCDLFEKEAEAFGLELSGERVLGCLSGDVRPQMVRALEILKERVTIGDRKSTRLNSSHSQQSRMPSSA